MSAAYRTGLLAIVEELIATDRMRPAFLFERSRVLRMGEADLLEDDALNRFDPGLASVSNLNEPADYERAHALPAPSVTVDGSAVRAWRLGEVLGSGRSATLNGQPVDPDPELPLVAGDVVALG